MLGMQSLVQSIRLGTVRYIYDVEWNWHWIQAEQDHPSSLIWSAKVEILHEPETSERLIFDVTVLF